MYLTQAILKPITAKNKKTPQTSIQKRKPIQPKPNTIQPRKTLTPTLGRKQKQQTQQVNNQPEINEWAATATATSTTQRHKRLLTQVLAEHKVLTVQTVLRFLTKYKAEHKIKWSTLNTMFGTAIGACRRAHLLVKSLHPLDLLADQEFKLARKTVDAKAKTETVNSPTPTHWVEVQMALNMAIRRKDINAARLLILAWATAGRPSCVQRLHGVNIVQTERYLGHQAPTTHGMTAITISFHAGKVVNHTGPYSIHTFVPNAYAWLVQALPPGEFIPASTLKTFVQYLKLANPVLESRSLRRGALQTMARHGATDDQLLEFSRHASKGMLYRYLGWGRTRMTTAQLQAPALFATL